MPPRENMVIEYGRVGVIYYEPKGGGGACDCGSGDVLVFDGAGRGPQFVARTLADAFEWMERSGSEEHVLVFVSKAGIFRRGEAANRRVVESAG